MTRLLLAFSGPSKPRIIHTLNVMSTSFFLSWEAPKEMRGVLRGYELEWSHNNTIKSMIIKGDLGSSQHETYISALGTLPIGQTWSCHLYYRIHVI